MKALTPVLVVGFLFIELLLLGKHFGFAQKATIYLFLLIVLIWILYLFNMKQNG